MTYVCFRFAGAFRLKFSLVVQKQKTLKNNNDDNKPYSFSGLKTSTSLVRTNRSGGFTERQNEKKKKQCTY